MEHRLFDLLARQAEIRPQAPALSDRHGRIDYQAFAQRVAGAAERFRADGLGRHARVAIYGSKRVEAAIAGFAATLAGGSFVIVNPLLKADQLAPILRDCQPQLVVAEAARADLLMPLMPPDAAHLIPFESLPAGPDAPSSPPAADGLAGDMAGIFYTSGSTGGPKGVVVSHRNLVAGAASVCRYLELRAEDRLLGALPLSFDYGFNQIVSAVHIGASVHLMDYLLPQDAIKAVVAEAITVFAGVPPLWAPLSRRDWPDAAKRSLRLLTNSGGHLPRAVIDRLRAALPDTALVPMYGLTEAFRSTWLPPAELDRRPDSMGRAIPGADLAVVDAEGRACGPGEPGELVHRGVHVALGYWRDPVRTAERFRPWPFQPAGLPLPEIAVFSGDTVRQDEDGYFYYVGRADDQIKSSGYRISPTEVEEILYDHGQVREAAVFGRPDPDLGQAVLAYVVLDPGAEGTEAALEAVKGHAARHLPAYMQPRHWRVSEGLPRNLNGKIDRARLRAALADEPKEDADG